MRSLPVVAVVGRPNVGKSSLVNRVLGRREAIVEEMPGVTRDRHGFAAEWAGRTFEIVDTGGLEAGVTGLEQRVADQAEVAIAAADVIVLVVDASVGPQEDDLRVADMLRRCPKPVVVAANKIDDPGDAPAAAAFYRLGLGDPFPLSALHGHGSGDLLDAVVARLPATDRRPEREWASVAIVGRPNVGKSSLLNALSGQARALVDAVPGTTRDPVDSYVALPDGRTLRFVDTAGMRRQVQAKDPIEYFSLLRSRRTLPRSDVALLVVDAAQGVAALDQRIAEDIVAAGRACVVALNKWDLVPSAGPDRARLERSIDAALRFLPWASVVRTSALTGRGVDKLLPAVEQAVRSHRRRVATAELNRIVSEAQATRPHPRTRGRSVRVYYAVQASVAPPTVVLFTNASLDPAYVRYLERKIRTTAAFPGSPIRLEVRKKARPLVEA